MREVKLVLGISDTLGEGTDTLPWLREEAAHNVNPPI